MTIRAWMSVGIAFALVAFASAQTPPPKDTFVLGIAAETATFYPPKTGGTYERNTFEQVFDALLHRTPDGKIVGRLATSWKNVNDLTWRFDIRHGVQFQDGEPLDAAAVKTSLDLYRAPDSVVASRYREIDHIDVVDTYTLDITTKTPDPFLPASVTDNAWIMAPAYLAKVGEAGFAAKPVGTGPYMFKNWVRGDHITFEANPNYWGGPVPIKTVIWRVIPEPSARVAALQSGQVDLVWEIPPVQVAQLEHTPNITVLSVPSPRAVYIGLWPESPAGNGKPLADLRVRQALNYAVNREAIVKVLQRGYGTLISQPIPNAGYNGYDPSIAPYPYDPAKAKALLKAAGYPNGFSMDLLYTGRYLSPEEAQAIKSDLAAVGVNIKLDDVEFGQYIAHLTQAHDYPPMYALSIQGTQGIDSYEIYGITIASTGSFNWNHYTRPAVDKLIAEMGTEFDAAKRADLGHQLAKMTHDDPPWIYLWNNSSIWGLASKWKWQPRSDDLISVYDDVTW